jgi:malonyl-CoA/methylmalonyl-CoA synthetase
MSIHAMISSFDICDWINKAAESDANRPFLVRDDDSVLSYGSLRDAVSRMAAALVALGVKPGDRVTAQVEKSPEALILYLACLWMGGVYMPLNTGYTTVEIDYFLGDAEPALLVVDPRANAPSAVPLVTLAADGSGSLMDALSAKSMERVSAHPDDLAAMCYTSGTTGRPKGAMISRGALATNAKTLADAWAFTPDDVLIHALPIYHVHGLFVATNTILAAGATMLFRAKFDAADVLALMPRATVLMGVPTFYTRLLQQAGLNAGACRNMRLFVSGSAPLLAETHDDFEARTGHAILERYGMTETLMNTSNPYHGKRMPGTVGFPLPGVSVRITNPDTGKSIPQGEIGMIEVKGPNLFKGYWRNLEKTAADMRADGHFITGDLGRIDASGYVHILGRGKDLIISGGLNIYPKEVETELDDLPGVAESALIGVPHSDFGEAVVAVVVMASGVVCDQAEMLDALGARLAKFKLPKAIIAVDELPRNAMGKVQKNLLRETYAGLFTAIG